MTGFAESLSRAARLYVSVSLAAAILTFAGVETWRAILWSFPTRAVGTNDGIGQDSSLLPAALYAFMAATYVLMDFLAYRPVATARLLLGSLQVIGGTVALYGLLAALESFVPSLPRYDLFDVTCISMSLLLGLIVVFHRRVHN